MTAIAGVAKPRQTKIVQTMLDTMFYRGNAGSGLLENDAVTAGLTWSRPQAKDQELLRQNHLIRDFAGTSHFSLAYPREKGFFLKRDPLGVAPLYYGHTSDGTLVFASEVKALLPLTRKISELPPGTSYENGKIHAYFKVELQAPLPEPAEAIALHLRELLIESVQRCINGNEMGSWLSGGLDSSVLAAIANTMVSSLHTFTAGLADSPDVLAARVVAGHLHSKHHAMIVTPQDLVAILPEVIYHLESFDALLVRSSMTNYLVAKLASDFVPEVLSGEGGDELFGGYEYLKGIPVTDLPAELVDIINRLHNTALQRVDRSASAHGSVAHVRFLDPDVVDLALRIPAKYKINHGEEKWILREAMKGMLPESILHRKKAKFWEGAGVTSHLSEYADSVISDQDFKTRSNLPNGWTLNSKEEFLYYQIFKEHFGEFEDLDWMGRTKGAPIQRF